MLCIFLVFFCIKSLFELLLNHMFWCFFVNKRTKILNSSFYFVFTLQLVTVLESNYVIVSMNLVKNHIFPTLSKNIKNNCASKLLFTENFCYEEQKSREKHKNKFYATNDMRFWMTCTTYKIFYSFNLYVHGFDVNFVCKCHYTTCFLHELDLVVLVQKIENCWWTRIFQA